MFFSVVRCAAAKATNALRFSSHDVSFNEHRLHFASSHRRRTLQQDEIVWFLFGEKKMNDFAYGKIYSPFKSFVNCDRVDMIACIQFVFVEMWSAVVALIRLAPANVCNQYFCFYFCFALPSASQSLSWKYYSFLLFGTNTHAHLADDATTTRPCTFHVHPTQYIYLKYRKYFVRFH